MYYARIKKESAWTFNTSNTGALGMGIAAVEGGHIYLYDPQKRTVSFLFGAVGAGPSAGFKLPKILQVHFRGKQVNPAVAPAFFPNRGIMYILGTFKGDELTRSDITGACMFIEIGLGVIGAFSAVGMILGMDSYLVARFLASCPGAGLATAGLTAFSESGVIQKMIQSATALLLVRGVSLGLIAGGGAGAFVGELV